MSDLQSSPGESGPGEPGGATSAASIVAAAERLAAEITRNAQAEADEIRARAGSESEAARAATAERVGRLAALADGMLERLGEMRAELNALGGSAQGAGAAGPVAIAPETEPREPPAAVAAAPEAPPEPAVAIGSASAVVTEQEPPAGVDDAGARLIALNLALSDTPRDEAARQLRDQVPDPERLVDEVYASVKR